MHYIVLLYADESSYASMSPEEMRTAVASFAAYNKELAASGVLKHGEQLKGSRTAKTLRASGGKVVTTDGPFAESKEQLGGYYVIEVESEEEAIAWASKCPVVWGGTVEIRELTGRIE